MGEVISTVALADQISREFNVSDQGIDMEIEFNDDAHEATGAKLQLKSGDSYTRKRRGAVFRSPTGRKKIAQRFIAGFPGGGRTSPVRDERI